MNLINNFTHLDQLAQKLGAIDLLGRFQPEQPVEPANCWLNHLGVISVEGADSEKFLQGQLTCNLSQVTEQQGVLGACCNAKGRALANFILAKSETGYVIVLPYSNLEPLIKHLSKYAVFFKTEMKDISDQLLVMGKVKAKNGNIQSPFTVNQQIELGESLAIKLLSADQLAEQALTRPDLWLATACQQGLVLLEQNQSDEFVPQHIDMHRLGGISFDKGCYTGQEIIARLQYLGKNKDDIKKKHLILLSASMTLQQAHQLQQSLGLATILLAKHSNPDKKVAELIQLSFDQEKQTAYALAITQQAFTEQAELVCINSVTQSFTLQNLSYTE